MLQKNFALLILLLICLQNCEAQISMSVQDGSSELAFQGNYAQDVAASHSPPTKFSLAPPIIFLVNGVIASVPSAPNPVTANSKVTAFCHGTFANTFVVSAHTLKTNQAFFDVANSGAYVYAKNHLECVVHTPTPKLEVAVRVDSLRDTGTGTGGAGFEIVAPGGTAEYWYDYNQGVQKWFRYDNGSFKGIRVGADTITEDLPFPLNHGDKFQIENTLDVSPRIDHLQGNISPEVKIDVKVKK